MKKIIVLLIIGVSILLRFYACRFAPTQQETSEQIVTEKKIHDGTLSEREVKVLECAGCHQEVYDNWKAGPHAYAHTSMVVHADEAKDPHKYPVEYANFVGQAYMGCLSCHTTQNLYETNFKGLEHENDESKYTADFFPKIHKMGIPRKDTLSLVTGIDCLTCHASGDRVVTTADFVPSGKGKNLSNYCDPIPSKFFSTNTNCVTCHRGEVTTLQPDFHTLPIANNGNCVSCHQEYNADGKGTHYYYWRHDDPKVKKRPGIAGGLFDNLAVDIETENKEKVLSVRWENKCSPHNYGDCGEVIVDIEILNENKDIVFATESRVNNKAHHDSLVLKPKAFHDKPVPGVVGYTFKPGEAALEKKYPLKDVEITSGTIRLTGKHKSQYWGADKDANIIYQKEQAF